LISPDIKPLTGIRFFAALAVVVFHLQGKFTHLLTDATFVRDAISWGHFAVPFFFILSGFILSHVYFPKYKFADHGHFIWLRFARLWPVHLAMTAGMVVLAIVWIAVKGQNPHTDQPFSLLLPDLLMVRSWYDEVLVWNIPAWSIQIEWFAYLFLFPLCASIIRPMRSPLMLGLVGAILLAINPLVMPLIPGRIGTILCLFPAGCTLYRLRVVLPNLAFASAIVWLSLVGSVVTLTLNLPYLGYLAFAGIIFGLSYEQGAIARLLSTRAVVYGGKISFSLYMSHHVVNTWTWTVWDKIGATGPVPVIVTFAAALLVAALVYHCIEVPANEWLRRRWPARTNRAEVTPIGAS
jgi:peptidoglycan/LPS O-acetylase OafA/YrhL